VNKRIRIALIVFIPIILIGSCCAFFFRPVNLSFAEKITLIHHDKNIHLEIKNGADFVELISLCKGIAHPEGYACAFGVVELIFEGNGKKLHIYPAGDSCNTMRLGDGDIYYNIKNREKLEIIFAKYDITVPWV